MQKYSISTKTDPVLGYGALQMTDELFESLPSWVKDLFDNNHWDKYNSIYVFQYDYYEEQKPELAGFLLFKQVMDDKGRYGAQIVSICTNTSDEKMLFEEIINSIIVTASNGTYWNYYYSHIMGYSFICFHNDDKQLLEPLVNGLVFENKGNVLYHYF